ncbi:uncharacterized protein LOC135804527 [Sycon ciliatum]|uniref:uncharacterized protein LOC135804527 n=1 Tax=Sycon ciliatum TaxID=27933 RepID=UPI0031F69952
MTKMPPTTVSVDNMMKAAERGAAALEALGEHEQARHLRRVPQHLGPLLRHANDLQALGMTPAERSAKKGRKWKERKGRRAAEATKEKVGGASASSATSSVSSVPASPKRTEGNSDSSSSAGAAPRADSKGATASEESAELGVERQRQREEAHETRQAQAAGWSAELDEQMKELEQELLMDDL